MSIIELESDTPVAVDPDRPASSVGALKPMKSEAGNVHVFNRLRRVEGGKLHPKAIRMMRLNSGSASSFEELSKPFMPK